MDPNTEKLDDSVDLESEAQQIALRQRLEALVTRFASESIQAMLDFDHLANDGLSDAKGNLLSHMGTISILDRSRE